MIIYIFRIKFAYFCNLDIIKLVFAKLQKSRNAAIVNSIEIVMIQLVLCLFVCYKLFNKI